MRPLYSGTAAWTVTVAAGAALAATAACSAAVALIVATACVAASILTVRTLYLEETRPMSNPNRGQSRTAPGVLRRRAARLAQLGIITSCVPDDPKRPRAYGVTSPAGEVTEVAVRDMPAYLDGLAAGHHAALAGGDR